MSPNEKAPFGVPPLGVGRRMIAKVRYNVDDPTTGRPSAETNEVNKLLAAVVENEDDFEKWEALIECASGLEGGVNRNANPASIELVRNVYDCFLSKFPLFYGYWRKYAETEFAIGGTETSEMVYERGLACIPLSVDLWAAFCGFRMDTSHDVAIIRSLFERGASFVGHEYQSHPFWDKYIEFEERNGDMTALTKLYARVFQLPLCQFSRYYEKFRPLIHVRPTEELVDQELLDKLQQEVANENHGIERPALEVDRQLRAKIDHFFYNQYGIIHNEVTTLWHFENNIKRPYFHVTELEAEDLDNWRKYLDHQESVGDFSRTLFLYERCLVPCALYEEFWLRYARWMHSQNGKDEDTRLIYMRASCVFVPISQPLVRLNWARFEEKLGWIQMARDVYLGILRELPNHIESMISLAGVDRRHVSNDAAVSTLQGFIDQRDSQVGGYLVAEQARILFKCKVAPDEARQIFKDNIEKLVDSKEFWRKYIEFEIEQPAPDQEPAHYRVNEVFKVLCEKSRLSPEDLRELTHFYMEYLMEYGGMQAADEFMKLDKEINGYVSSKYPSPAPGGNTKGQTHAPGKKRKSKGKAVVGPMA